jgi:hypothetical protein
MWVNIETLSGDRVCSFKSRKNYEVHDADSISVETKHALVKCSFHVTGIRDGEAMAVTDFDHESPFFEPDGIEVRPCIELCVGQRDSQITLPEYLDDEKIYAFLSDFDQNQLPNKILISGNKGVDFENTRYLAVEFDSIAEAIDYLNILFEVNQ